MKERTLIATTIHDPEGIFLDRFEDATNTLNENRFQILANLSQITVKQKPAYKNIRGVATTWRKNKPFDYRLSAEHDFRYMANRASEHFVDKQLVIYTDGDTLTHQILTNRDEFLIWIGEAVNLLKDKTIGVVHAVRSESALLTYPEPQRLTEKLINLLFQHYFKLDTTDVTTGIFAFKAELSKKWAEENGYWGFTNNMDGIVFAAVDNGFKVIGLEKPHVGDFESGWIKKFESSFPITNEYWANRIGVAIEWIKNLAQYQSTRNPDSEVVWRRNSSELGALIRALSTVLGKVDRVKSKEIQPLLIRELTSVGCSYSEGKWSMGKITGLWTNR